MKIIQILVHQHRILTCSNISKQTIFFMLYYLTCRHTLRGEKKKCIVLMETVKGRIFFCFLVTYISTSPGNVVSVLWVACFRPHNTPLFYLLRNKLQTFIPFNSNHSLKENIHAPHCLISNYVALQLSHYYT